MDLAYIPNHCSGKNTDLEFFKRVRASYYVVSGNDPANGEPSRVVLDALLEGKSQWGENLQVSDVNAQECVMFTVSWNSRENVPITILIHSGKKSRMMVH